MAYKQYANRNPIRDIPDLILQVKEELIRIKDKKEEGKKKKKAYLMKDGSGNYYKL